MGYTVEDIKNLQNPYQDLIIKEELAEHLDELNQLNLEEKISVATRIVNLCPEDELKALGHQIEALRIPQNDQNSFHAIAREAFTVKKLIVALSDPRNSHPHDMVLGDEFNEELFKKFPKLIADELKIHGKAAAQHLALTTPIKDHFNLEAKLNILFPDTQFIEESEDALDFRIKVHNQLFSEDPSMFFDKEQFSADDCLRFSNLLTQLIKGNESRLGSALITSNSELNSHIFRCMEMITPQSQDQLSPWRLVHEAMAKQLELQTTHHTTEEIKESSPVEQPLNIETATVDTPKPEIISELPKVESSDLLIAPFLFPEVQEAPLPVSGNTNTLFHRKKNQTTTITNEETQGLSESASSNLLKKPDHPKKPDGSDKPDGSKKPNNNTPPESSDTCCNRVMNCSIL